MSNFFSSPLFGGKFLLFSGKKKKVGGGQKKLCGGRPNFVFFFLVFQKILRTRKEKKFGVVPKNVFLGGCSQKIFFYFFFFLRSRKFLLRGSKK